MVAEPGQEPQQANTEKEGALSAPALLSFLLSPHSRVQETKLPRLHVSS